MPTSQKIKIPAALSVSVEGLSQATEEIQKNVNSIQFNSNRDLKEFQERLFVIRETLKALGEKIELGEVDAHELKEMEDEITDIIKGVNTLSKKTASGIAVKGLKKDVKVLEAFNTAMKNASNTVGKMGKSFSTVERELKKQQEVITASKTNVEELTRAQQENQASLDQALEKFKTKYKQNRGHGSDPTKDDVKELEALHEKGKAPKYYEEFRKAAEQAFPALDELKTKIADNESTIATAQGKLQDLQSEYNNLSQTVLTKVVSALQEFAKEAGIALDDFGISPEDLNDLNLLNKAILQLQNRTQKAANEGIADITDRTQRMSTAASDAKRSIDETGTSLDDLTRRANDVQRLRDSLINFFSISNQINIFKRSIRDAYNSVKELDAIMTETAVVTDYTISDMWQQIGDYTKRANELGVAIQDTYKAATLYYQQGLQTSEVTALSNETLKMARIASLDAAEATDRMTNALRGFNMELNETSARNVNDVYSQLAAITASDVDEISTAMTKVASLANNANMSFENTSAFLSQIIETTRESAETAGTALKTVIARFSEVKQLYTEGQLTGTDEEGEVIDVNRIQKALRTAGVDMTQFLLGKEGLDQVFIRLAEKWDSLTTIQQRYIATQAAGSRQQSRFIALMQDYERMQYLTEEATNANGASQRQFEKTLDSLQSKLARLKNEWTTFTTGLANNEVIKTIVDLLTNLLGAFNKLTDGMGGVGKSVVNTAAFIGMFAGGNKLLHSTLNFLIKDNSVLATALGITATEAQKNEGLIKRLSNAINGFSKETSTAVPVAESFKIAFTGYGGQLKTAISGIGTLLVKIAPYAAVIGAIAGAIYLVIKAIKNLRHSAEYEYEALIKYVDNLKNENTQVINSYNELNSAIENLRTQQDTIKGLTKGTEEWQSAVEKNNQSVRELLEKYKELGSAVKISATGELYIDFSSAEYRDFESKQALRARLSQGAVLAGERRLADAEANSLAEQARNGSSRYLTNQEAREIGRLIASQKGAGSSQQEVSNIVRQVFGDERYFDALGESVYNNISAFVKLGDAVNSLESKMTGINLQNARIYTENMDFEGHTYAATATTTTIASATNDALNKAYDAIAAADNPILTYAQQIRNLGYNVNTNDGVKGITDDQGNRVDFADVIDSLANSIADIENEQVAKTAETLFKANDDLARIISGDVELIEDTQALWDSNQEQLENIGYTLEEYQQIIWNNRDIANAERQALNSLLQTAYAQSDLSSFTADELSSLRGTTQSFFAQTGSRDNAKAMTEMIVSMLNETDNHEIRKTFLNTLSGIDFTKASSIRDFSDKLKDLQVDGKWTNEQLDKFESHLIEWADALNAVNWDAAINGINELLQVLQSANSKEILSFSEDLKGFLTTMGLATEDQFIKNIDGNYNFTGSWQDLFNALQSGTFYSNSQEAKNVKRGEDLQRIGFNVNATAEVDQRAALAMAAEKLNDDYIQQLVEDSENGLTQEAIDKYNELVGLVINLEDNQQLLDEQIAALQHSIGQVADPYALMGSSDNWKTLFAQSSRYGVDQEAALSTKGDAGALGSIVAAFKELSDFGIDTSGLDDLAKSTTELFKLNPERGYALAASIIEYNEGLSKLADNYEDINTVLSSDNTASVEYNEKLDETLRMLEQISMVNKGSLNATFFENNIDALSLMEKAAKNDQDAIVELQRRVWEFSQNEYLVKMGIDPETPTELSNALAILQEDINQAEFTVGMDLDATPFITKFVATLEQTGNAFSTWSENQRKAFSDLMDSMGVTVTWTYETKQLVVGGNAQYIDDPDEPGAQIPLMVAAPVPHYTAKGSKEAGQRWSFSNLQNPTTTQKLNDNANKGASEKNPTWKNPYDELYNLNEEINEQLRQREKIERDYDRLIKRRIATTKDLKKDSMDTIASLRREVDLQRQLQEGRLRQINNIGQMDYIDSEGNLTNFAATGATAYASYANGEIHIDWEGLQAVQARGDDKLGSAIEAYISQMEEWVQDYEKTEETIEDMEDEIYEISQRGMKEYLELEERVYDALVQQEQKIIDDYSELSKTIDEANSKIVDSLNEQINLERQIRDNTKQEEDIADMQRRLAYLRMDTSGANALEIASLENQIQEAQENYTDRLIDQAVQKLQDDNQKASEQREQQIAMMQAELEWRAAQGDFWPQTYALLEAAFTDNGHFDVNSDLAKLLEETEAFQGMSYFGKENWLIDMAETFAEAMQGQENWQMESAKRHGTVNVNGQQLTWDGKNWVDSNGKTYNVGYDKDKGGYYVGASGSTGTTTPSTPTPAPAQPTQPTTPAAQNKEPDDTAHKGVALAIAQGVGGWYNGSWQVGHQLYNELVSRHFNFDKVRNYVNQFAPQLKNSNAIIKQLLGIDPKTLGALYGISNFPAYKQGGLANKTGLAWLDGTFTKPEAVLNPEQTANFVRLRDILDKFMQNHKGSGDIGNSYFDININVDQIANDYDVQRLAARIKQEIQSDSMYRNVNSLGRLR